MSQHTPGPWKIFVGQRTNPATMRTEFLFAQYAMLNTRVKDYETASANARLIAAAPDMLAALQGILSNAGYTEGQAEPTIHSLIVARHCLDAARAAVAKAEGN